jgi:hypothetical protein
MLLFAERVRRAIRRFTTPLVFYYGITVAVPLANGAAAGDGFLEHAAIVLLLPIAIIAVAAIGIALARWIAPLSDP